MCGFWQDYFITSLAVCLFQSKPMRSEDKILMVSDTKEKQEYDKQEIIKYYQYIEKAEDSVANKWRKKYNSSHPEDSLQTGYAQLQDKFFNFITFHDLSQKVKNKKDLLSEFKYIFFDNSDRYNTICLESMVNNAVYKSFDRLNFYANFDLKEKGAKIILLSNVKDRNTGFSF
jgi:predicted GTPase